MTGSTNGMVPEYIVADRLFTGKPGAEQYAALLARRFNSEVTLFHVLEVPQPDGTELPGQHDDDLPRRRAECERAVGQVVHTRFPRVHVREVIEAGDPAEQILAYAKQHKPDLILMPTHGWSVFRESLIGGVTAKVLHGASCPVWTGIHLERRVDSPAPVAVTNITSAIDLGPQSEATLFWAAQVAKELEAQLTVVHVLPVLGQHESANQKLLRESAEAKVSVLIEKLPLQPRVEILVGDPAEVICGYVNESFARMLREVRAAIRSYDQDLEKLTRKHPDFDLASPDAQDTV